MSEPQGKLAQGTIVWAQITDARGQIKRYPAVILTATGEIDPGSPIQCVAITTSFPEPPPREYVELPWFPGRHPATQLSRRSAAVCNWLVELSLDQVQDVKGFVPTKVMLQIVERVRDLNQPNGPGAEE